MSKTHPILYILALFLSITVESQDFKKLTYFQNDTLSLDLDLFLPKNLDSVKTPLVIYVHGGGFVTGNRGGGHNLAEYLVGQNIACASISYSLYMKGRGFGCEESVFEKVKAIQIAANDLWQSTSFLIEKSQEFNIDIEKIFIAGSSAGAETVLHAAYWERDQMQLYENKLPSTFKYAGVISGAGAIMDLNLITKDNAIPLMSFHGDADLLVPYKTASHHFCPPNAPGWLMLFGAHPITEHLKNLSISTQLITFEGGGHSHAGTYFYKDQQRVYNFIHNVLNGERFNSHEILKGDL